MKVSIESFSAAVRRLNPQLTGISADGHRAPARAPEQYEREADLHNAILDWCAARGYVALHGSTAHRTHRTLGEPDFIVLTPFGRTLLIECKINRNKMSEAQRNFAARAAALGHTVHIVRSIGDLEQLT